MKDPHTPIKVTAHDALSPTHIHTLSLLYRPIIGGDAHSLYMLLHALIDRSRLASPTYPHAFFLDLLGLQPEAFIRARRALEASGLLETFEGEEDYLLELYMPLSPEAFIKDSPFGPYLKHVIGEDRFADLIAHFKIVRTQKKGYTQRSVSFDEVFPPLRKPISTRAAYIESQSKKVQISHAKDIELVLDAVPKSLLSEKMRTTRVKDKLREMAYIYQLNEEELQTFIKQSLNDDKTIDFTGMRTRAQRAYQNKERPPVEKKTDAYNLEYFKRVHPKTLLEETTGMRAPAGDLKVIERLIENSELPLEVLNVMIAYVLKELEGQFPVYNYFEKIVAEWKRADVETADDAVNHIKRKLSRRTAPSRRRGGREKPVDTDIDWFDEYLKEQEEE